ncbi:hypothetical protein GmHk_03G006369 [Glycine max]|nr:hypothetical protein GmHk_03G006369 [Glycine max]
MFGWPRMFVATVLYGASQEKITRMLSKEVQTIRRLYYGHTGSEITIISSILPFYYCPSTGKRFYSYSDLMCYVNYAKKTKLGLYALGTELLKRKRTENDTTPVPEPKKTSTILSLPKDSKCYSSSGDDSSSDDLLSDDSSSDDSSSEDSSSDDSSSDDLSSDDSSSDDSSSDDDSSDPSISNESIKKDEDYAESVGSCSVESVGSCSVDSETSDATSGTTQVLK